VKLLGRVETNPPEETGSKVSRNDLARAPKTLLDVQTEIRAGDKGKSTKLPIAKLAIDLCGLVFNRFATIANHELASGSSPPP